MLNSHFLMGMMEVMMVKLSTYIQFFQEAVDTFEITVFQN